MPDGNTISSGDIPSMTSARRETGDSVHLLVMDMHQAINRLTAATAPETIDGAKVHCAEPEDRPRIKAFMSGVNRTKALAFGHPGLGTTAVRTGTCLTIQNDIGTTDAHVLVVHVEHRDVTVTYTDVHRPRAKFFISLFDGQTVTWGPVAERDAQGLGEEEIFYLLTGRFKADDEASLTHFLEFLGSRVVFLIDWNKARKALQTFVGRNGAISLLTWALEKQRGVLLAFAGVLDHKLACIARDCDVPLYLVRDLCLLQRKSPSSTAYWQRQASAKGRHPKTFTIAELKAWLATVSLS